MTRPRAFTVALLVFVLGDVGFVSFALGLMYALLVYAACRAKELLEGI
jgi:hypothetical protein